MSDQLFNPAMILPIPGKSSKTKSNMGEAVKTEVKEKSKSLPVDIPEVIIEVPVEEEVVIPPIEPIVEKISPPNVPDSKKLVLTKSKDKTRTSYIIDKKIVQYIDGASRELKYGEMQNYHQGIVAEEILRIGQYFYEKYRHELLDTITSGDQISEFIFRQFRKDFNIVEDE